MKRENRCASQCSCNHSSRRDFIRKTALFAAGASVMGDFAFGINLNGIEIPVIKPHGEALHYQPIVKAAFVRRKGDYGLRWPGAVFDGEGAKRKYTEKLNATAKLLNIRLEIKETPRISWSRMNDDGIPAACEADTGAIAAHVMVQYLFNRPGFQQDPVADTSDDTIIGAHCSCPTRLNGFDNPPEPFDVVENMIVPPSGGCVVSIKVKLDGGHEVLNFPGFHQLFFYGDYKSELEDFCQLFNYEGKVV